MESKHDILMAELEQLAHELDPWFVIDKVKDYSVYVWTKDSNEDNPDGENVFDIFHNTITFYPHAQSFDLKNEVMRIIRKIQDKLYELYLLRKG